jgi:tRNA pseudouridine38-40 synthase
MRQIALEITYDGTSYSGWQIQNNAITVQGIIQGTLGEILKTPLKLNASGRTDTGVHAIGQIASFKSSSTMKEGEFQRALNSKLPHDVRVIRAFEVPLSFHPRYSAKRRWYRYIITNEVILLPFFKDYTLWVKRKLDVQLLQRYCNKLLGTHDFTSFATLDRDEIPYREVFEFRCFRKDDFVVFDIVANGFLRKMVRTIIGSFLELEKLSEEPERVSEILTKKNRGQAGQTIAPQGLYLVKVFY